MSMWAAWGSEVEYERMRWSRRGRACTRARCCVLRWWRWEGEGVVVAELLRNEGGGEGGGCERGAVVGA